MDQKTWLWRKRSSEKTIIANGKAGFDLKGKVEEVFLPNEKEAALEESVKILNEKLASLTSECNAKEELLKDHGERVQEAAADKEKAEMEILHLKKQLDEALQQKADANERLGNLNVALKDCMQQLSSVREEKEHSVHDAIARTSNEFEKTHKKLEDKLAETSKKFASLTAENSHLYKALQVKEKLIEDLSDQRSQAEAEFNALMVRLDSVEKENAFLRYEFRMLEKDLDIRNEELEFARRNVDAAEKHYLQSVNKIKKLESECQRLRVLVRKRLPAPTHLAAVKAEVEMQERFQIETRRRKMNSFTGGLVVRESTRENLDMTSKRISFLVERLQNVEQDNKVLRDLLTRRDNDVISSHKEHETSSTQSWDSALISGLELVKHGEMAKTPEHKMLGITDMSLMDDFVEMEKLAIVAVDVPLPHQNASPASDMHKKEISHNQVDSTGMELVLVEPHEQLQMVDSSSRNPDWLQAIVNMIMEQLRVSVKSMDELLQEIKNALQAEACEVRSSTLSASELLPVSGYITWKSPITSPSAGSCKGVLDLCSSMEDTNHELLFSVSTTINRMVELARKLTTDQLKTAEDYVVHIFGWKASELSEVLQRFIGTCNHLLNGNVSFEKFAAELSLSLEWIMSQCVTNELGSKEKLSLEKKIHSILELENKGLKTELSSLKSLQKSLEVCLQSAREKSESLSSDLEESRQSISNLQIEIESLAESRRMIEDQFENQKMINEELDTQLNIEKVRLNDVSHKLSSLEVELEDKNHHCEELEGTCLELKLQLESIARTDIPNDDKDQDQKLLQTGWEIKEAALKLAECEAAILGLGNQLKATTQPNEASFVTKVVSNPIKNNKKLKQHFSLLDRILTEEEGHSKPAKKEELSAGASVVESSARMPSNSGALVVYPSNKRGKGIGFVGRLLIWKKRGSKRRTPFPFAA